MIRVRVVTVLGPCSSWLLGSQHQQHNNTCFPPRWQPLPTKPETSNETCLGHSEGSKTRPSTPHYSAGSFHQAIQHGVPSAKPAVHPARRQGHAQSVRTWPRFERVLKTNIPVRYPEELADRAWDNVGLLQENINLTSGTVPSRVLLTNDLTITVAEEAIKKQASVIVSYRTTTSPPFAHRRPR